MHPQGDNQSRVTAAKEGIKTILEEDNCLGWMGDGFILMRTCCGLSAIGTCIHRAWSLSQLAFKNRARMQH